MKKLSRVLPFLLGIVAGSAQAQLPAPTRLIVRLHDDQPPMPVGDSPGNVPPSAADRLAQINRQYHAGEMQRLNPGRRAAAAPAMYLITLPAGTDAQRAVQAYQQTGLFRYVELDAQGQGGGVQSVVPNDPFYGRQWYLNNNGTFALAPAQAGADIRMEDAWAVTHGDSTITVALIDSGCKLDHPEFAGRIWRNRLEIPNNRIDDDHNGFVDDVKGWNFVSNNNNPTDDYGHGTNVAGIVGATGNNGLGYAGLNWGCKLMICKGLNAQNMGSYSWWTSAIYYAVDNGARVINMSLGGSSPSLSMQDAVAYATQHGVVVAACMMNDNSSVVNYPAGLAGVIAVGATNPDDSRASPFFWSAASGSNYGAHLSVVAPGNYIFGPDYQSNTNYYVYWGGTSQATPQVAGLASLLLTLRPQLTPAQVKAIIERTADDRVGPASEDAAGWDLYFGYGRINAGRALANVLTATQANQDVAAGFRLFPNPARGAVTLQLGEARLLQRQVQVYNALGQLLSQQPLTGLSQQLLVPTAAGTYWVAIAGMAGGQRLVVE
ncbi:S8 family serine peptidase [Hymenobacter sp. DH14]|uniref:S8 family serine peptidase n=1 Tax=Hymenobacter cyanobacteriorum TaxID=2926463 RepID=A0A9X2AF84_9BACT|nr:S8 family serine peptidase [Hymenobacter cyanobacteriorum]MCI1187582.1 S8 family serine peptidase [Hymenobacter cyanobacteriorum]